MPKPKPRVQDKMESGSEQNVTIRRRLSLHPLSLEDALRGAAATGPVTEPEEREAAADQVRAAARKSGQSSRGRKRRLKGEPNPDG
jgi:hypothetical protein